MDLEDKSGEGRGPKSGCQLCFGKVFDASPLLGLFFCQGLLRYLLVFGGVRKDLEKIGRGGRGPKSGCQLGFGKVFGASPLLGFFFLSARRSVGVCFTMFFVPFSYTKHILLTNFDKIIVHKCP